MKFCFLSQGSPSVEVLEGDTRQSGGAEAQVAYLAAAFAGLGHDVELIYGYGLGKGTSRVVKGVRCIDIFPSWTRPTSLIRFWKSLRETRPDLIYARIPYDFLWIVNFFTRLESGTRFIYALSNDRSCIPWRAYPPSKSRWFHNLLYALWLPTVDLIAIQHEAQAQLLKPYVKGHLFIIPNLVRDVQSEPRRYNEATLDAIWITHIRPQKQLSVFLDIVEQLPEMTFAIVGGFPSNTDQSRDERRIHSLKNLRFMGRLKNEEVIQLLKTSKVLVNTSSWEGFPNTMLEAWSIGVPVVSLQIDPGGVISREGLGLVSKTLRQIVHDITKLVREQSLNYEMGKRGQDYVRRVHGIEAVCRGFEQILPGFQAQHLTVRESTE